MQGQILCIGLDKKSRMGHFLRQQLVFFCLNVVLGIEVIFLLGGNVGSLIWVEDER